MAYHTAHFGSDAWYLVSILSGCVLFLDGLFIEKAGMAFCGTEKLAGNVQVSEFLALSVGYREIYHSRTGGRDGTGAGNRLISESERQFVHQDLEGGLDLSSDGISGHCYTAF